MDVAKINLNLGSAQREFLFRKGTVDEAVIVQVLKTSACDLGRLRRGAELAAFAQQLAAAGTAPLIIDVSANIGAAAVFFAYKFPMVRIVAVEADPAKFQLLTANTADLPVECMQSAVVAKGDGDAAPGVTIDALYDRHAQDRAPFVVKLDVENDIGLFAGDTGWIERTPVIIAALSDYLLPGTANSCAVVASVAHRKRDLGYLHDNIFSVSGELGAVAA